MVTRYRIEKATAEHVTALAPKLRTSDKDEVMASHAMSPTEALLFSLDTSHVAYSGFVDDEIILMWGISPAEHGFGAIWMLASDDLEKHRLAFLRRSKVFVNCARSCYSGLGNFVDARNTTSIQWLRWLGFTIGDAKPHGPFDLPFHPFWMRA